MLRRPTPRYVEPCIDLSTQADHKVELEITDKGQFILSCPCCQGAGEHQDRPGNNPMANAYKCHTCRGDGTITPDLSIGVHTWQGTNISRGLRVTPNPRNMDSWHIHGPDPSQKATGSRSDLLKLAHQVIDNLRRSKGVDRLDWIRSYRELFPAATLQDATRMYLEQYPDKA